MMDDPTGAGIDGRTFPPGIGRGVFHLTNGRLRELSERRGLRERRRLAGSIQELVPNEAFRRVEDFEAELNEAVAAWDRAEARQLELTAHWQHQQDPVLWVETLQGALNLAVHVRHGDVMGRLTQLRLQLFRLLEPILHRELLSRTVGALVARLMPTVQQVHDRRQAFLKESPAQLKALKAGLEADGPFRRRRRHVARRVHGELLDLCEETDEEARLRWLLFDDGLIDDLETLAWQDGMLAEAVVAAQSHLRSSFARIHVLRSEIVDNWLEASLPALDEVDALNSWEHVQTTFDNLMASIRDLRVDYWRDTLIEAAALEAPAVGEVAVVTESGVVTIPGVVDADLEWYQAAAGVRDRWAELVQPTPDADKIETVSADLDMIILPLQLAAFAATG
jgi:hypothetical protein